MPVSLGFVSLFCLSFSLRIDWNLMLDFDGGPNHAGNLCDSPVVADKVNKHYYIMQKLARVVVVVFALKPIPVSPPGTPVCLCLSTLR